MNESQLKEKLNQFLSGDLPEVERLELLDRSDMVRALQQALKSNASISMPLVQVEEQKSDSKKIEDLIIKGEIEFAMDLLICLGSNLSEYETLLEGGKIDHNGRPWPSHFCSRVKEQSDWGWGEECQLKWYQLFGLLAENCPTEIKPKFGFLNIESLNLGEKGSYGFFEKVKEFPDLLYLATDRNLPNLSIKCPVLKQLDFRRFTLKHDERLDLSLLEGCNFLEEINLCYQEAMLLSDLPILPQLKRLDLRRCWSLREIETLPELPLLEELELAGSSKLSSLGDLSKFPHLRKINLKGCENLTDLNSLTALNIEEVILPSEEDSD